MQDAPKAVWSIPYVSVAFFPSLKLNSIAYHSSKVSSRPDCIFEIHQLWQSGFSRVYSNSCCSCSFESEIIKIGQSSHKMYSNNILNFHKSTTILNACTKKVWKLIEGTTYIEKIKYSEDVFFIWNLPRFLFIRLSLRQCNCYLMLHIFQIKHWKTLKSKPRAEIPNGSLTLCSPSFWQLMQRL